MPAQVISSSEDALHVSCDALVIGAARGDDGPEIRGADGIDAALDGHLAQHLAEAAFKAKVGDVTIVPTLGRIPARCVAVVGLGAEPDATSLRRAAGAAARRLGERASIASCLHEAAPSDDAAGATAEGFLLGAYRFTLYKTEPHPSKIQRVLVLGAPPARALERGATRAEATILARDLTNEPASTLSPRELARRVREMAGSRGLECTILEETELEDKGFGGILGVGKGSSEPPLLIQLHYSPQDPVGRVILVGKGITFDSGGLSLKPAGSMESMKTDMAGSAAVIGVMSALERLGIKLEVSALVASAENMPSSSAVRPGDVLVHYGGKTTEVTNTDAEGRLVLADALAFGSEQKPDAIVDVATLTGAIMVALGAKSTGVFSNEDALADELISAALAAGERAWRMPLYPEYLSDLDSEVADHKNSGSRWGGAILAALFLKEFVGKGIPWAHLDIAGPARAESAYEEVPKGGTGVATRTLISWLEARGENWSGDIKR